MAGHSQFKNIMHRKGRQDAARSKLFAKLAREIWAVSFIRRALFQYSIPKMGPVGTTGSRALFGARFTPA